MFQAKRVIARPAPINIGDTLWGTPARVEVYALGLDCGRYDALAPCEPVDLRNLYYHTALGVSGEPNAAAGKPPVFIGVVSLPSRFSEAQKIDLFHEVISKVHEAIEGDLYYIDDEDDFPEGFVGKADDLIEYAEARGCKVDFIVPHPNRLKTLI